MIEIKSEDQFYELIAQNEKVMVDFWGNGCGPCQVQKPLFEALETESVKATCNIQENMVLAQKLGIKSVPTFISYINNGQRDKVVNNVEGLK